MMLAGLCHDLGHGPFSHVFDSLIIPTLSPGSTWSHEDASCMLIEHMIDQNNLPIEKDQLSFIQSLIEGDSKVDYSRKWLYDVISSKRVGLDVDRFDYMRRDPLHLGQQDLVFHPQIYLDNLKIIDGNLCFSNKMVGKIHDFFAHRYRLHKHLYSNTKCQGYNLVLADLFVAANSEFKFEEYIYNPEKYLKLHNGIIDQIGLIDNCPETKRLHKLFETRGHYRLVGESLTIHKNTSTKLGKEVLRKMKFDLISCSSSKLQSQEGESSENLVLTEDNCVLVERLFSYCSDKQTEGILIYDRNSTQNKMRTLSSYQYFLQPSFTKEYCLNFFIKDKRLKCIALEAWTKFLEKFGEQIISRVK